MTYFAVTTKPLPTGGFTMFKTVAEVLAFVASDPDTVLSDDTKRRIK